MAKAKIFPKIEERKTYYCPRCGNYFLSVLSSKKPKIPCECGEKFRLDLIRQNEYLFRDAQKEDINGSS
jgi:DNA-directed RNA polymerase subunit RPC12/RpoP